jgi:lysophospholipase L1-like esterase
MLAITKKACVLAIAMLVGGGVPLARAEPACGPFTKQPLLLPMPRRDAYGITHWQAVKRKARTRPHRVLFLGDSLVEFWDSDIWQRHYGVLGAFNAGIAGDLTANVLWRLSDGLPDVPPPRVVVLLIGTNDLGARQSPQMTAEGVRRILVALQARLPQSRTLLLGLWPRGRSPTAFWRGQIAAVNRMIQGCADGRSIVYLDLGPLLLAPDGELPPAVAPDGLHLSPNGYRLIAPRLDGALTELLDAPERPARPAKPKP